MCVIRGSLETYLPTPLKKKKKLIQSISNGPVAPRPGRRTQMIPTTVVPRLTKTRRFVGFENKSHWEMSNRARCITHNNIYTLYNMLGITGFPNLGVSK